MFRPDSNRDRTDYSGILMPPDGYRLDRAVGTTYSLDLEALTAVAICLGLSEETDSKLMQNPIGMLNALQKVSDKIVLFCEAGQIKVPTKPTALSILLEKMVVEVALPKDRQLAGFAEPERANVFAYAVSFECGRHKAEIGQRRISGRKYRTEIQLYAHPP